MVESDCRVEDIPHSLAYNMVVTQMAKDEKTNHQVLKQALAVVQDNLEPILAKGCDKCGIVPILRAYYH